MANIEEYLMTLPLPIGSYMLPETDDGPARIDWAGTNIHGQPQWAVRGNGG